MEKDKKPAISIIVPVYNEAENLRPTIDNILGAVDGLFADFEILIIDCVGQDGRDDGTREIAKELANSDSRIRHLQNPYVDLGTKYWQGVGQARFEYLTWLPGDNETSPETISGIFKAVGRADMVVPYTVNKEVRSLERRIISGVYTFFINLFFGLKLRYFNGPAVHRTELLRALLPKVKDNKGFSFNVELLIRLIRVGYSYVEIPMYLLPRRHGKVKSLSMRNLIDVTKRIIKLFWELQLQRKNKS